MTVDELPDDVWAQVTTYKYPRRVWFVDALPKGPTGNPETKLNGEVACEIDPWIAGEFGHVVTGRMRVLFGVQAAGVMVTSYPMDCRSWTSRRLRASGLSWRVK